MKRATRAARSNGSMLRVTRSPALLLPLPMRPSLLRILIHRWGWGRRRRWGWWRRRGPLPTAAVACARRLRRGRRRWGVIRALAVSTAAGVVRLLLLHVLPVLRLIRRLRGL